MESPGAGNATLDQAGSQRGGEKWPASSCLLKVESAGFADREEVGEGRRGVLDTSKDLGLSPQGFGVCYYLLRCRTVRERSRE